MGSRCLAYFCLGQPTWLASLALRIIYNSLRKKRLAASSYLEKAGTLSRGAVEHMRKARIPSNFVSPTVTIRVSGSLSQGHVAYVDQLVSSAIACALWPLLDLEHLVALDHDALTYLLNGEGRLRHRPVPKLYSRMDAVERDSRAA